MEPSVGIRKNWTASQPTQPPHSTNAAHLNAALHGSASADLVIHAYIATRRTKPDNGNNAITGGSEKAAPSTGPANQPAKVE
jgi:hypothetical protein